MRARDGLLLAAAGLIALLPLLAPGGGERTFGGSDDRATAAIAQLAPGYRPWIEPAWKPPSPTVESLLFALQAAAGAGFLGYYLGLRRGAARARSEAGDDEDR